MYWDISDQGIGRFWRLHPAKSHTYPVPLQFDDQPANQATLTRTERFQAEADHGRGEGNQPLSIPYNEC